MQGRDWQVQKLSVTELPWAERKDGIQGGATNAATLNKTKNETNANLSKVIFQPAPGQGFRRKLF